MESPPKKERNDLFIAIGAAFFAHQIPVASLIAHEESSGRFLMTDLGAADLESHYGKSSQNAALKAAIDLLPKVATASAEHIAPYTKERPVKYRVGTKHNDVFYNIKFWEVMYKFPEAVSFPSLSCTKVHWSLKWLVHNTGFIGDEVLFRAVG